MSTRSTGALALMSQQHEVVHVILNKLLNVAGTFTFPGIYCCIDHEKQNTLSPLWGLYIFIQFQGGFTPLDIVL